MGNIGGMKASTALLFTTGALLVVIASLSFPLLADAEMDSKPAHHGVYEPKTPPPKKSTYVPKPPPKKASPPPHKPYYMPPQSPKKPPVKHMPLSLLADAELDSKPAHHGVYEPKTPPPPKKKPVYMAPPPPKKSTYVPKPPPKKKYPPPLY